MNNVIRTENLTKSFGKIKAVNNISLASGLIIGKIIQLSGWSDDMSFRRAYTYLITSLISMLLSTPVAFFASYGRGYLPPLGFVILTLIIAQFISLVGLGPYFPWAIPALYTENAQLGVISYIILFLTIIYGLIATLAWWRFADQ
ncbi:hypothetical protein GF312_00950 [Candidatus Poribacteria bacterium]|nr:hypothetical protein [Candidatus Poribacteria bacterium]